MLVFSPLPLPPGRVVKAIIFALVVRHLNITYRHKVAMSEWQDGVIVFPSGDVVVRLPGLRPVDTTIEAVCLTYAVVKPGCSIARCRPQSMLQIHFKGLDAAESVVSVCQADLRESALTIAAYINDVKSKSNTSF
ncbi:MAG: hypothetical protein P4L40_22670 [Terracidiphilus sp.]|nr:hypothetical protein [Terracidiphilus sp.]